MAGPGYDFDRSWAERIIRTVRKSEADAKRPLNIGPPEAFGETLPVLVWHDGINSSDVAPPYGVMAVTGAVSINGTMFVSAQVPSTNFHRFCVVNGPNPLPYQEYGHGYNGIGGLVTVLYSTPPTTSIDGYGPKPGSWKLEKNYPQTSEAFGIVDAGSSNVSTGVGSTDMPTMLATLHPINTLLCKAAAGTLGSSSSASLEIYSGTPLSESTQTGQRVTVYNKGPDISTGFLLAHAVDGAWYAGGSGGGSAGADEKLAASSENDGVYWDALHNEFNGSTIMSTGKDLLVESEVSGTTPNQKIRMYVDCSDISGYTPGAFQFIGKTTGDILTWITATTACT